MTTLSPPVVYDPYSAAFKADPLPVYRRLRNSAPVYVSEKWGFPALSRFDDVRAAARDHETFLSFEGIDIDDTAKDMSAPGFLPDIDNPRHDQLRRIVQRTFLPRTIAKLEDDVRRVVTGLVDRFADTGEADIAQDLSWPIPYAVSSTCSDCPPPAPTVPTSNAGRTDSRTARTTTRVSHPSPGTRCTTRRTTSPRSSCSAPQPA